jgi:hydroxymethylpyrimidine/phosphomethylpyrimidine kinase
VLILAGSDSGGGAGIQADIKTVTMLGGYAMTAITALTAQNTLGVQAIHEVPLPFLKQQITSVMEDIGTDAFKTGMLHSAEIIHTVAEAVGYWRARHPLPLVVDPVMTAKGGASLLAQEAKTALISELLPLADVLTPNLPEAEALTGLTISTPKAMEEAANRLRAMGAKAVLLKGGHLAGNALVDILATAEGILHYHSQRIETPHTHGTGCTLASALACGLAQGMPLEAATIRARDYVRQAIATAPGFGQGHGPLNHGWLLQAH